MQVAWATDVHLEFVERVDATGLCARIQAARCTCLLLGGDIATSDCLSEWLGVLDDHLDIPVYFVLGNHDYYGSSVAAVRETARRLTSASLVWLPAAGVVELDSETALVGHGGWGDARIGTFLTSPVILNDYILIEDLKRAGTLPGSDPSNLLSALDDKPALQSKLHELGDEAANHLRPHLEQALSHYPRVIALTHVPPFREACWHRGAISSDDWLPGFTCKAMGDMLLDVVGQRPDAEVTVLCGHTHGEGEARPLPNLRVLTGGAEYGSPAFQVLTF